MPIFIRSTGNISPQPTFSLLSAAVRAEVGDLDRMRSIEPEYSTLFDAKSIRRMSRIIRMGVASAMDCLKNANVQIPDAIITGTAYGCLEDTEVFLTKMVQNKEELLSPTSFIQSTHNTVGAQIALILQCHGYNNTFVNRGFSFEYALLDAILLLREDENNKVLVGGLDEITEISHTLLRRFGLYRNSRRLAQDSSGFGLRGSVAGEGAQFFLLTGAEDSRNICRLEGLHTLYKPATAKVIDEEARQFLSSFSLNPGDIDLVLSGRNGDLKNDAVYDHLSQTCFLNCPEIPFKHLCGQYPTASAFGLWLATYILKFRGLPSWFQGFSQGFAKIPRRVLVYHHYENIHHALILISVC
jgi:3-oxoacyl-[acyl-carrier-protein] synthase II